MQKIIALAFVLLLFAHPANAGPASCIACLGMTAGEAAAACAVSGPGYIVCILAAAGIWGAIVCGAICLSPIP